MLSISSPAEQTDKRTSLPADVGDVDHELIQAVQMIQSDIHMIEPGH